MRQFTISAICLAVMAAPGFAQKPKAADDRSASGKSAASLAPSKTSVRAGVLPRDTFSQWEYWTNVTIPPGSSVNLDSQLDYSTTDTVRVTIRSAAADLGNVRMIAYWTVPPLLSFGVAEVVAGTSFPYLNAGGATFNTYGPQFRLQVANDGPNPMMLTQVLLFTRVH